jgi:alkanesulfonate monooxygenase SsuD/methylene tetrahydromethanopterin reductase-like flavin-dependent oxidoreductase (luciferase family)
VQTAEDLVNSGVVLVGSPSTVRDKLEQYQELAGFNTSLTKTQFGTMPSSQARSNAAAIAEEIIPYFRAKAGAKAAAE